MRKLLAFLVLLGILAPMLAGCGGNSDADLAISTLKDMGNGNWGLVFKNLHEISRYTNDPDEYTLQMKYKAQGLSDYLKGAEYEVVSESFEKSWMENGKSLFDVNRITLKVKLAGQTTAPTGFPFVDGFVSSGVGDVLVAKREKTNERAVVLNMGDVPMAFVAKIMVKKGESVSPQPKLLSDPDPTSPGNPPQIQYYEVFDKDYQHSYWIAIVETYTKVLGIAIADDLAIRDVMQIVPPPNPYEMQMLPELFGVYRGLRPEMFFMTIGKTPKNASYIPYAQGIREAVAQSLKLMYIEKFGFDKYRIEFPSGMLSFKPGMAVPIPPMETTKKTKITPQSLAGKPTVFILISSCASCRNRALEVKSILTKAGLAENRIIFISKSPVDKLEGFLRQIGNSHLVIDSDQRISAMLNLSSSPSLLAINSRLSATAQLDSAKLSSNSELNVVLPKIVR